MHCKALRINTKKGTPPAAPISHWRELVQWCVVALFFLATLAPSSHAGVEESPGATATPGTKRQDLIAYAMGGTLEKATSTYSPSWTGWNLLDDRPIIKPGWCSSSIVFPQELVFSFFAHQPALISAVVMTAETYAPKEQWAKDVEVWASMDGADTGFSKLGEITLRNEPGEQTISVPPTQTRFVKLRILSNYGHKDYVELRKVKVIEGQAPDYVPMIQRYPDLAALVGESAPDAIFGAAPGPSAAPAPTPAAGARGCACEPLVPVVKVEPAHAESRKVLVVSHRGEGERYSPTTYKATDKRGHVDYSIYDRLTFVVIPPEHVRPTDLLRASEFDTVVLSRVCDIKESVSDDFRHSLPAWIAAGHKLIIQDSDNCGPRNIPDYSFLPYPFATGNAGANAAPSDRLIFVEENRMANPNGVDPGFLDVPAWLSSPRGQENWNEIGDSNLITRYDAHWCGHLFTTNVKHDNGFVEAYAHHGRGLLIYDGFDADQHEGAEYRQIVTRELAQPFDPDGLPCSAKIGDFILTTEEKLKSQVMVPGKTYNYPLILLSNHGYKGDVKLSFKADPTEPTLSEHFDSDTIALTEISNTRLVVTTTTETSGTAHQLEVRGTDAAGRCSTLCLKLTERMTGGLHVRNDLHRTAKPTKNLEIILDLSGSMKYRLGNSTRIETARKVLAEVLAKIPDDFNVGLRFYGNRYGSRQKETCTDTELVAPIAKLDRAKLLNLVNTAKPRGETPLVYSVLQTPADLQAVGGGSVILITDGEESCGGDPKKAAEELQKAGVAVTLDIVGFTLTGQQVQRDLTQFAEATGGRYYRAENAQSLARALLIAATEKIPYEVYDSSGKQVAAGLAGDDGQELPAGDYRVAVKAGDQHLVAEHVTVATGKDAAITVTVRNDQFELESR
ncbi:MAG: hypothetical protein DMF17_06570 [Verrucomicrobia bacterium]|nr:MAG: hypothetical protein DMF17_06570 [Verrucomicrobiota bacterium]